MPKTAQGFSSEHQALLDLYAMWFSTPQSERPDDCKSILAFSEKHQISRDSLYKWQKIPYFIEQLERLTKADRKVRSYQVKQVLYDKALSGDVPAIKLYKEWIDSINQAIDIKLEGKQDIEVTLKDIIKAESDDTSEDK